ncbi:hypothetical protein [Albirhodobacter sp. R86504]|uniref:hypothetical protein n=1 Tax=Albirhodobacter sp. R86504 TaxID=3093848 RepID=UPI00366B6488
MSTVAALRATLGLDGSAFRQGLNAAKGEASAFSSTLQKLIAPVAAAIGVAFSGAAIRNQMAYIDAQAKMAQSLGTTSASLQVMERAGELAGVSLDSVEQSAKDLQRRLSQAASGGGPVADALAKIHLNAQDLMALPLDQRVAAINGAINEFIPAAQRAAIAGQLFGEEGSLLMTRLDPATISQAATEISSLGYAISELDANKIEQANDAISALGLIGDGLVSQITVALAPALDAMARGLAAVMAVGGPVRETIRVLGEQMGRLASYALVAATALSAQFVAGVAIAVVQTFRLTGALAALRVALMRTGIGLLIVAAGELVYQFTRLVKGAGSFGTAMSAVKDVAVEVWERIKMGASLLGEEIDLVTLKIKASFAGAFASVLEGWASMMGAMGIEGGGTGAAAARATADELASGVAEFGDSLSKSWGAVTAPLASMEALRSAMNGTQDSASGTSTEIDALNAALDDVDASGGGAAKGVGKTTSAVEKLSEKMSATKDAMKGAFSGIVTGTKSVKEALADLLQSFATFLAESAFENFWAGSAGTSGGSGVISGIGKLLGFANGTPSAPGGLALVGERGAELVNLPRGSQVIPAEKTRQMMGGGGTHTTVDVGVSVSDDGQLQAYVNSIASREAQAAAKSAVRSGFALQQSSKTFTRAK